MRQAKSLIQIRTIDGRATKEIDGYEVRFSQNSKVLAGKIPNSENEVKEKLIKLWTIDGVELKTFRGKDYDFSPDGSMIAVTDQEGIHLWKTSGEEMATFRYAERIAFSPDSKVVATERRGEIEVYTKFEKGIQSQWPKNISGSEPKFSPSGKFLAVKIGDNRVKLIDIETGGEENIASTGDVQFSQDGSLAAFQSPDMSLRIMQTASREIRLTDGASETSFLVSPKSILVTKNANKKGILELVVPHSNDKAVSSISRLLSRDSHALP